MSIKMGFDGPLGRGSAGGFIDGDKDVVAMNAASDRVPIFVANLCAAGDGMAYTRRGWSEPEAGGTWTVGRESHFAIDVPGESDGIVLAISATPYIFPGLAAAHLEIVANGAPLGSFSISQTAEITCAVPASVIGSNRILEVTLRHPDAARPSAVSASTDSRELAFLIAFIELRRSASERRLSSAREVLQPTPATAAAAIAVLRQFENLGDNCEFGLVQRRCGVEPLTLFRFANAPLSAMIAGLEKRFDGLDDPGALSVPWIAPNAGGLGEYYVCHSGYGVSWHTAIYDGANSPARIHAVEQRKLQFLKRNFLHDLEEAARIYVVRRAAALDQSEILPLWRALRRYGPNTLLWVVPSDMSHPSGTVIQNASGLLQGFIDHLAPDADLSDLSIRGWIEVCSHALELRGLR
jgi:hypothetical protein